MEQTDRTPEDVVEEIIERHHAQETSKGSRWKTLSICAIGLVCGVFLAAAMFRVLLFLIQNGKGEYLLHPLAVAIGTGFVATIARGVILEMQRRHEETMHRLDRIERLITDRKLEELRKIKNGRKTDHE